MTMLNSIGVGRFRILGEGGQGLEYWGAKGGGGKFPAGTWRRNDVASTSFRRHVPTRLGKSVPNYYISHLKV